MKKVPKGYFSKKQFLISLICLIFFTLTLITVPVILYVVADLNYFLCLLICLAIGVLFYFITAIVIPFTNPLNKILREFSENANYQEFSNKLDDLLNENLCDESKNFILILKSNFLTLVDFNKSYELFKSLTLPKTKSYSIIYQILEIGMLLNKNEYDLAIEKYNLLKEKNKRNKNVELLSLTIKIITTDEKLDEEKLTPLTNTTSIVDNIIYAKLLIVYYLKHNELDKAKEYANFIISKNTDFIETNNFANEILSK